MAKALEHGGLAMTVTSLTSVVAFLVAAATSWNIPGFVSFNLSLAFTLLLNWIGMLFLYPALCALNEKRIAANRMDLLPCCKSRPNSWPFASALRSVSTTTRAFVVQRYAPLFERSVIFCLSGTVLILALIGFASFGAARLDHGMPDRYFVRSSSPAQRFFDDLDASFGNQALVDVGLFLPNPNLTNGQYQSSLRSLLQRLDDSADVQLTVCWPLTTGRSTTSPAFVHDIARSDTGIEAARCHLFMWQPMQQSLRARQTQWLLSLVDASGLEGATAYHRSFPIHVGRYENIKWNTISTALYACAAVFLVLLVSMPARLAMLSVSSVGCVLLVLFGFMGWVGVTANAISYGVCVMAVGFCVDPVCHIVYFMGAESQAGKPFNVRVRYSLQTCGYDVLHGCITTFLGVLALLAFSATEALRIFGLLAAVISTAGAVVALFALPAALALPSHLRKNSRAASECLGSKLEADASANCESAEPGLLGASDEGGDTRLLAHSPEHVDASDGLDKLTLEQIDVDFPVAGEDGNEVQPSGVLRSVVCTIPTRTAQAQHEDDGRVWKNCFLDGESLAVPGLCCSKGPTPLGAKLF
eukprot:TRINITY_DN22155_c0_g1_i2.p1 TRINITY_DN22155_c0_g1~~TRINITY_DN22155_c0_g1_i2.p1  ORF type:complete len:656 (+),score=65.27 TRINITY_DN22155_c0_g1_i2:213-1970(+)